MDEDDYTRYLISYKSNPYLTPRKSETLSRETSCFKGIFDSWGDRIMFSDSNSNRYYVIELS